MLTQDIEALKAYFVANWTNGTLAIFDNQPNVETPADAPFVRFSVRPGASEHSAGSAIDGIKTQLGRVWLKISVPEQSGDGAAIALAEAFATIFRNKRLDSARVYCRTEEIGSPIIDEGRFVMTVSIPWESARRY